MCQEALNTRLTVDSQLRTPVTDLVQCHMGLLGTGNLSFRVHQWLGVVAVVSTSGPLENVDLSLLIWGDWAQDPSVTDPTELISENDPDPLLRCFQHAVFKMGAESCRRFAPFLLFFLLRKCMILSQHHAQHHASIDTGRSCSDGSFSQNQMRSKTRNICHRFESSTSIYSVARKQLHDGPPIVPVAIVPCCSTRQLHVSVLT
eukprot:3585950-Amphidinium_carterae.1